MSVVSADLLAAAQRIFDSGTCEADWRAVCSRSYYAVYHDIQAFADSLAQAAYPGNATGGKGMHHQLYVGLQHPTVPKGDPRNRLSFKLGLMAQGMHSARMKADYEPTQAIDQIEAQTNLTTAHNIPVLLANGQVGTPLPKFNGPSPAPQPSGSPIPPSTKPPSGKGTFLGSLKVVK